MKDLIILDNLKINVDKYGLIKKLCIQKNMEQEFIEIFNQVQKIAKPKALFAQSNIKYKTDCYVVIKNIKFCSRILTVNLKDVYKVYPYLATVGLEIEKWSEQIEDFLIKYWVDIIKEEILKNAEKQLFQKIDIENNLSKASHMNPGSLDDWPVSEQRKLFELLGNDVSKIGISLTDSMLMYPTKSVSGIRFPTEVDYENCQLCKRIDCPARSASYQPNLLEKKYNLDLKY